MVIPANLGFPRLGGRRELKAALEYYWAGEISDRDLLATGQRIRRENWALQAAIGLGHIPSNVSFYDHVLDMAMVVSAIPDALSTAAALPGESGHVLRHGPGHRAPERLAPESGGKRESVPPPP